jgi:hypothetical protein
MYNNLASLLQATGRAEEAEHARQQARSHKEKLPAGAVSPSCRRHP